MQTDRMVAHPKGLPGGLGTSHLQSCEPCYLRICLWPSDKMIWIWSLLQNDIGERGNGGGTDDPKLAKQLQIIAAGCWVHGSSSATQSVVWNRCPCSSIHRLLFVYEDMSKRDWEKHSETFIANQQSNAMSVKSNNKRILSVCAF